MTQTNAQIADEAGEIEREMNALGRFDVARKARKLRDKALAACLAEYYAKGIGASVLRDVKAGFVVTLRAEARAAMAPGPAADSPEVAAKRAELAAAEAKIEAAYWRFSRSPSPRVGPPDAALYARRNDLRAEIAEMERKKA